MAIPAILIAAGAVIVQASGAISVTADVLKGVDQSITAVVDLHKYVPQVKGIFHHESIPLARVPLAARKPNHGAGVVRQKP